MRSSLGISFSNARSKDVLPLDVPPEIKIFKRAAMAASKNADNYGTLQMTLKSSVTLAWLPEASVPLDLGVISKDSSKTCCF